MLLLGCEFLIPETHITPLSQHSIILYDEGHFETNIESDILDIRVGHFARVTYQTETGNKTTGLVATMWLLIQGNPNTSQSIQIYTGRIVNYMGCKIQVLRVDMDKPGIPFVELEISPTEETKSDFENEE